MSRGLARDYCRRPLFGPEDDFFEVGGDSLKAMRFMIALERALGLELSVTLITEAPKFANSVRLLREHRTSPLRPARSSETGRWFTAGLHHPRPSGNVAGFFPMARRMTYPGEVIGIQARGLAGEEPTAHDRGGDGG